VETDDRDISVGANSERWTRRIAVPEAIHVLTVLVGTPDVNALRR
jgi:hypothetical protein